MEMSKEDICPHTSTNRDNGHVVCTECGEVLDIIITDSTFKAGMGGFRSQQSTQYIFPDNSLGNVNCLGSDMGNDKTLKDAYHKVLPKEIQPKYKRLQKYSRLMFYPQYLSQKGSNKNYSNILQLELKNICRQLKINKNTMKKALYYLVKIINSEEKIVNKVSLMALCLYYTVKQDKVYAPISTYQIINKFNELGHRLTPRILWRDELLYSKHFPKKEMSDPMNYIYRYVADVSNNIDVIRKLELRGYHGDKITFKQELEDMCKLMLDKLPKNHFMGCSPRNIAGTIIYSSGILLANKHDFTAKFLTQKSIHDSTGVLEYSIRDLYSKYIRPIFIKQKLKFINKRGMK